jgi:hypothetical protein
VNARERQIDHVMRTRERQMQRAADELTLMEDPLWAGKALVRAQIRMALAPSVDHLEWRRYAVKPERILAYMSAELISVGMLADALDELAEKGLVVRGMAGDYWWDAQTPPPDLT